jgi:hypothetical protein
MKEVDDDTIREALIRLPWWPKGDPTHMEYVLELMEADEQTKGKLLANGLDTMAAIHSAIASGAESAAAILRGGNAE